MEFDSKFPILAPRRSGYKYSGCWYDLGRRI